MPAKPSPCGYDPTSPAENEKVSGIRVDSPAERAGWVAVNSSNAESIPQNHAGFILYDVYDIVIPVGLYNIPMYE